MGIGGMGFDWVMAGCVGFDWIVDSGGAMNFSLGGNYVIHKWDQINSKHIYLPIRLARTRFFPFFFFFPNEHNIYKF